eukprot:18587_1
MAISTMYKYLGGEDGNSWELPSRKETTEAILKLMNDKVSTTGEIILGLDGSKKIWIISCETEVKKDCTLVVKEEARGAYWTGDSARAELVDQYYYDA